MATLHAERPIVKVSSPESKQSANTDPFKDSLLSVVSGVLKGTLYTAAITSMLSAGVLGVNFVQRVGTMQDRMGAAVAAEYGTQTEGPGQTNLERTVDFLFNGNVTEGAIEP